MLKRFLRNLSFKLNPPKPGDVFFGQSQDFIPGPVESCLHNLTHHSGVTKMFHFNGLDTYRLTIKSIVMPYYICDAEVLAKPIQPTEYFEWSSRCQPRRIDKKKFKEMFLSGKLKRAD